MAGRVDRRLTATLAVVVLGVAACGDDDSTEVRTVTVPAESSADQGAATGQQSVVDGDAILIRTRITDGRKHEGTVLDGSFIGESAFCAGGTTSGGGQVPIILTFSCPGGRLTVKFAVTQPSPVQNAIWEVVRGSGRFEGLRGGGSMVVRFSGDPEIGRETFTGAVGK